MLRAVCDHDATAWAYMRRLLVPLTEAGPACDAALRSLRHESVRALLCDEAPLGEVMEGSDLVIKIPPEVATVVEGASLSPAPMHGTHEHAPPICVLPFATLPGGVHCDCLAGQLGVTCVAVKGGVCSSLLSAEYKMANGVQGRTRRSE